MMTQKIYTYRVWQLFLLLFLFVLPVPVTARSQSVIVKYKSTSAQPRLHKSVVSSTHLFPQYQPEKLSTSIAVAIGLDRIAILEFSAEANTDSLVQWLQAQDNVAYAQLNRAMHLHDIPNDSLYSQQWYLDQIGIMDSWKTTQGNHEVLVAIIDTGIDYNHEDLVENLWINPVEDLNGNGRVDGTDFNGVDDDNNGFIDDIRGWDFTDAPHFPDEGDYLQRDADPMDEHGHGTSLAGIIAATANNQIGVAGIAPNCRLLNLRAGTSQGLLEEDDVASAIVYAVNMGAKIINMSFGDEFASPLLQDVMQFAHAHDVVLIASAGNSSSDAVHYPSGYHETISVGAVNKNGVLAAFSNFGPTMDIVAPGVDLMTCDRFNQYRSFSGTSAAAPVIAGVAALVLSNQPQLTADNIRNILVSTTTDIGEPGWDSRYASGRVNAAQALAVNYASEASIIQPRLDDGWAISPQPIVGTASGALLSGYILEVGVGHNPQQYAEIVRVDGRQVVQDTLGWWNFEADADTSYTIRLTVLNNDGTHVQDATRVFVDRTAPLISDVIVTPMYDGADGAALIEFLTDDLCTSELRIHESDSIATYPLQYITNEHRFLYHSFNTLQHYFSISAQNRSGLISLRPFQDNPPIQIQDGSIINANVTKTDVSLPSSYMLPMMTDWDRDGHREMVVNPWIGERGFDKTMIYEYMEGDWQHVFSTNRVLIPRDVGDSDGDGLLEMLVGVGPASYLLEADASGSFSTRQIWGDSTDAWASRISDLDQDGKSELLVRTRQGVEVREHVGNNQYDVVALLENPTDGENSSGVPHSIIGDFDKDGRQELLLADNDGDVYIYENTSDDQYALTWSARQPLVGSGQFTARGDFDGDGSDDFAVASHTSSDISLEHEYDARHWIIRMYHANGDNTYSPMWEHAFFGYDDVHDATNGMTAADVDADGRAELLLNLFPDFYLIDYDSSAASFAAVFHAESNFSQTNSVGDIDNDGNVEFAIDHGDEVRFYRMNPEIPLEMLPLARFEGWPLDTHRVYLRWEPRVSAEAYSIFRGESATVLKELQQVAEPYFTDSLLVAGTIYWYAVAPVYESTTGPMTDVIAVTPGAQPYIISAGFMSPNQVELLFSESMDVNTISNQPNYRLFPTGRHPQSAIVSKGDQAVLLTFTASMTSGEYFIEVSDVRDQYRTPIDPNRSRIVFSVLRSYAAPWLVSASKTDQFTIELRFNEALIPASAETIEHYSIQPSISIAGAQMAGADSTTVRLSLASGQHISALGKKYVITVSGVTNRYGIPIDQQRGNQASLVFFQENLSQVFTYPNPCRVSAGQSQITFANLTTQAHIHILNERGQVIRQLDENDGDGGVSWDLNDESGQTVRAGIYIYYVKSGTDSHKGTLAIVR